MNLTTLREWVFAHYGRRQGWLNENLTPRKVQEMLMAGGDLLARREDVRSYPLVLKVDITPLCQLACSACVHARPRGDGGPLDQQRFASNQKMSLAQFRGIIDEVAGHSLAVSLYYMGDPFLHPQVDQFCRVAFDAGLNVHLSSSLSFAWSDQRIEAIARSGVTHLTACVDGATSETYSRIRVGGRLSLVLDNLRRLAEYQRRHGLEYPKLEVQFVEHPLNRFERDKVRELAVGLGIRRFYAYQATPVNWAERPVSDGSPFVGRRAGLIPHCYWPYVLMLIRYDGEVIPCCLHRIGEQYTSERPRHLLGNVFQAGVGPVWNGEAYRAVRRLVADPARGEQRGELQGSFCYGCPLPCQPLASEGSPGR